MKLSSLGLKIIAGDYNQVITQHDRINKNNNSTFKTTHLHKLIKTHNLIDIWRDTHKNYSQFTWRRRNGSEKSRIDYFLIDLNLRPSIFKTDIRPAQIMYTDHQAVSLKIYNTSNRGPNYWKMNNMHLKEDDYKTLINQTIDDCVAEYRNSTHQLSWDYCKLLIKEKSILYAKNKAKERKNKLEELEKRLKTLTNLTDKKQNEPLINEKLLIESEINNIYQLKAKGAQIRARSEIIENDDSKSKIFFGLEKTNQSRKVIHSLKIGDEHITNNIDILKQEVKFYQNLYMSEETNQDNIDSYLRETTFDKILSEQEASLCDGLLTLHEATDAILHMKLNKSPGLSGLTVEFYQTFWEKIKHLVVNSINEGFHKGELSSLQKQGVLSLIFKKGDPENIENWRPISLLNTDYKILTRVLAMRLQKVLPNIINFDQQGYLKNRNIAFNIRQIQDVIDFTDNFNIDGIILFLDFRKAFDTCNWKFLFAVLKRFGFNLSFISWMQTIYNNCTSCIMNNGWKSEFFPLNRGLRQGCPSSALIFIIIAEIMALNVRNNSSLQGIKVKLKSGTKRLKITQLADDTTLFLSSKNEINTALKVITKFGKNSGLELNKSKTEGLFTGKLKLCTEKIGSINWQQRPVKALGVYFGTNKTECSNLNWNTKLEDCERVIKN